jgi:hypothetical protein
MTEDEHDDIASRAAPMWARHRNPPSEDRAIRRTAGALGGVALGFQAADHRADEDLHMQSPYAVGARSGMRV